MSRWRQGRRTAAPAAQEQAVVSRRVFRRVRCPVCGERRREMRVFGTQRHDESGNIKPRRRIRAELDAEARAWSPEPICDRCRR